MRFGEIYRKCKDNYDSISGYYQSIFKIYQNNTGEIITVGKDKLDEIKALNEKLKYLKKQIEQKLGDIECFKDTCERISYAISNNRLSIQQKMSIAKELLIQMECIIQLYESMGQNKRGIGLDIKIPETEDITEFKKYIDGLEFVLTKCPFFQSDEASLKFRSVDIGSTWLIIAIVSTSASLIAVSALLNNIVAFIDKCWVIKSHKQTYLMQQQEIEKSEFDQKKKEQLIETVLEVYKISVSNAIKELEETTGYRIQDGDERGRAEQSLEKLEKLIDKGLQIYASIDSPPETKALFEPLEMHYLSIAEELKRIEQKPDDGDKE